MLRVSLAVEATSYLPIKYFTARFDQIPYSITESAQVHDFFLRIYILLYILVVQMSRKLRSFSCRLKPASDFVFQV
jgi:hypothetical protein